MIVNMVLYSFAGTEGFTRRMMNQIDPMIGIRWFMGKSMCLGIYFL